MDAARRWAGRSQSDAHFRLPHAWSYEDAKRHAVTLADAWLAQTPEATHYTILDGKWVQQGDDGRFESLRPQIDKAK